ncbi:MAG: hypothetical protein ACLP36_01915 [Acidimicrobiales bacterium]
MTTLPLPHRRTVRNAPRNAQVLAERIRDGNAPAVVGPQPARGETCTMCGRTPPSGQLFEIVTDSAADHGVRIGIGRCHRHHLGRALRTLLARERALRDPARATGIARLEQALQQL